MGKRVEEGSAQLTQGVSSDWLERLRQALAPLEQPGAPPLRGGLAADLRNYVLTGEPASVLSEVSQQATIGECLRVTGYHYGQTGSPVYEGIASIPIPWLLRWARFLEACGASAQVTCRLNHPQGARWPELLLTHSSGSSITGYSSGRTCSNLTAPIMEALLVEAGLEPSSLLQAAFGTPVASNYGVEGTAQMISKLDGYPDALDRHVEAIRPLIRPAAVNQRLHVLGLLARAKPATLATLADELADLATASSKQVRAAAEPLVRQGGAGMIAPLQSIAATGQPEQRGHALQLLKALADQGGDGELDRFVRDTAAADKAPSVQALLKQWEGAEAVRDDPAAKFDYALPLIQRAVPVTPAVSELLDRLWRDLNTAVDQANERAREHHRIMQSQGRNFPLHEHRPYPADELLALRAYLECDRAEAPAKAGLGRNNQHWQFVGASLPKLAAAPAMTPVMLFKCLAFFRLDADHGGQLTYPAVHAVNALFQASGRPTLLELGEILRGGGYPPLGLMQTYCHGWQSVGKDWPADSVWPFFAHHLDLLTQTLVQNQIKSYTFEREGLFRAITTLPHLPASLADALFTLALGPGKSDRIPAQDALTGCPDKEARIVAALADGKSETRAVAAQWLAKLRHRPAVPALEQAYAKEKHDLAKGALLDALQALGQPVEKYLDRGALLNEAAKSLTKGLPKELAWFPWDALPAVRWADSGEPVAADILRWMLAQAVKQKSPEPNAILRKYCAMFEPRSREAFGQFILETWLREDVHPITADEAMKLASDTAQAIHGYMQRSPQYYQDDPNFGKSVEELTAAYLPRFLRQPAGSLTASKGVLAVAAACCAERAAAPVGRYLKEWFGSRAAQGKALIAMLAWIEHPSATQLMLAVGNRFRTKSFQEEATRQAQALADRKGWTLAELADRTIPSAGFDEAGTLDLSYGERHFTARLLPDFSVELFNPDGKKIKALPEPRQDDDAELAKDAKKAFSAAKKELKTIVDLQTDRLYEALCTERDWPYEDWELYLNRHPVMRQLVQRLVWVRCDAESQVRQCFRPLDDGSLTNRDDEEIKLAPQDRVRLAHDSLLEPEEIAAWQQHLADYQITPLFQQLGKGVYTLPETQAKADAIKEYEGHLLEAFALRGRASKLGYTRGSTEDGGWFYSYEKRFPTLGLLATIEFTGNPLPETNRTVALIGLSFSRVGAEGAHSSIALARVPKVLLSECYNDLRLMAAEGSGHDPDWRKKTEY